MSLDPAAMASQDVVGPKFTIITKALAGAMSEDGRRRFKMTASSTIVDMAGDEIEMTALEKMAAQFREGRTIFMNHEWKNVDSAFGLTDSAEIIQRGFDPKTNKPIFDLDIGGVVNTPNPRAVQLADSIDGGFVKLGASVTAIVRKHRRNAVGGMNVSDVEVIEASVVGVPENQRSWAQKAAVAIKGFGHVADFDYENDEEETVSDEVIEKGMDAPQEPSESAEPVEGANDDNETTEDAATAESAAPATEPGSDESVNPDGQESDPPETPETASEDDSAEADADTPTVEKAYDPGEVKELVGHTARMATEIGRLKEVVIQKDATIEALTAKVAEYEGEAGAITSEVDQAAKVIEKVLQMPLRPRAQAVVEGFAEGSELFAAYPGISEYLTKRRHLSHE